MPDNNSSTRSVLDWFLDGQSIHDIVIELVNREVIDCNTMTPEDRTLFVQQLIRQQVLQRLEDWSGLIMDVRDVTDQLIREMDHE